jgi:3beta-hydroxysteroid-4beta-carboxylate 3-dehydrogenase (decarboxylating)
VGARMILLTGANGHLGANLLRRLIADGESVRVLLRPESDNSSVDGLNVERVFGDLRDPASLVAATRDIAQLYHCAARVSTVIGGERQLFESNVLGTRNALLAALQNGVRRVVVSSSLSAVGHRADRPTGETEPFNPFERHLPYALSKAAVEHECLKATAEGLDVVIAVSCAILGPYDFKPSRMGQVLVNYANGRLHAFIPGGFEFVAARDIVEGHVLAMQKGRTGQRYIFSTEFMTLDALFDLYSDITGRSKPLRLPPTLMMVASEAGDFVHRHLLKGRRQLLTPAAVRLLRMGRKADIGKAKRELGYLPTSIAGAVREGYQWFLARGTIDWPRGRGRGGSTLSACADGHVE